MQPPKYADRFLERFCNEELLEDLQGDLYEFYCRNLEHKGQRFADVHYWWLVLRSFRLSAIKPIKTKNSTIIMTTINLKIAARVLRKDAINSSINLFGLTLGITCFILMGLYVTQETSYDQFHGNKDRIYRSYLKETYDNGNVFFNAITPPRFEGFYEENIPEVVTAVQFFPRTHNVGRSEEKLNDELAIISPEFFEVFDFELLRGKQTNPLESREAMVISEKYAQKYFGNEDPLGKTLEVEIGDDVRRFVISAIFEDIPINSSIKFDIGISNEINDEIFGDNFRNAWFTVGPETYVLLQEGADPTEIGQRSEEIAMGLIGEARSLESYEMGLQPITDIHLNPDIPLGNGPVANPQYVFILGLIGVLVLIIACINYATLAVGQSIKRAREVGVRKVMGAVKVELMWQYLSESLLMSGMAMIIGTTVAILLIPTFNVLTNSNLQYVFEWWHVFIFLGAGLAIGLLAGLYPALILSRLKILEIISGRTSGGSMHSMRKGMVVFQFLITVFLISSTLIMRKQVNYLQNEDLGYSYKTSLSVRLFPRPGEDTTFVSRHRSTMANGELLKRALTQHPEVSDLAMASHTFGSNNWANLVATEEDGTYWRFRFLLADPAFIPAFDITMAEGRNFEEDNLSDERQGVIINQAAVKLFELEDPIGKKLPPSNFGDHIIIGVTEDFKYSSLHNEVDPLIIVQNPEPIFAGVTDGDMAESPIPKLMFSYNGPNLVKARELLETEWNTTFGSAEMNWEFLDERIDAQYENEQRMNTLVSVGTVLSILIAMLGLVGLIILVVNSKVKEIGIRKVMGADTMAVFKLLYNSFALPIGIAIVLSVPMTIWLMLQWLDNFAYRVDIGVGVFVISAFVATAIVGLVVGYHAWRASHLNPVESLRAE